MKIIFSLAVTLLLWNAVLAQSIIATTHAPETVIQSGNNKGHKMGKAATSFEIQPGSNNPVQVVYFNLQIVDPKKITARYKVTLQVLQISPEGDESYAWHMDIPFVDRELKVNKQAVYSNFREGQYKVLIFDNDNENTVFYTGNFSVTSSKAVTSVDYKQNSKFVICKYVDDNWNPVGETKNLKAGECCQFLYKAKDKIYVDNFMIWGIYLVKPDSSLEFVNELQQAVSNEGGEGYRFLATDNVCEFSKKGKYRIYLVEKAEWDSHHGDAESCKYFGKTEFTVQ